MDRFLKPLRAFSRDQLGGAAVEFAIIGPILVFLLMGIVGWGGYFWVSHAVQQVTNDAARAAVAGLDQDERTSLASAVLNTEIDDYAWLKTEAAKVTVTSQDQAITVRVVYDATHTPFWVMKAIVPLPSPSIARSATVRLGGY
ncbi:MAG: pilus assembly protein [Caulobacter sp.]|nr:pilus assembly protein [Caulobacter sp.]